MRIEKEQGPDQEGPGDLLRSLDLILKAVRSCQWEAIFNKRVI